MSVKQVISLIVQGILFLPALPFLVIILAIQQLTGISVIYWLETRIKRVEQSMSKHFRQTARVPLAVCQHCGSYDVSWFSGGFGTSGWHAEYGRCQSCMKLTEPPRLIEDGKDI